MKNRLNKLVRSERGIALVIVMMAVLALTIVTVEFVYTTRVHYAMAQNMRDRLQAEYLAKSGIQLAMLVIKFQKQLDQVQQRLGDQATLMSRGPLYKQIPLDTNLLRAALQLGGKDSQISFSDDDRKGLGQFLDFNGDFAAQIDDEQGKINLNALADVSAPSQGSSAIPSGGPTPSPSPVATPARGSTTPQPGAGQSVAAITLEQLKALIDPQRYDEIFQRQNNRNEIVYNILDWVDADSQRSGANGGYEDGLYSRQDPPYVAKNAKFDSVEELALVDGVNQDFLETFRSSLTVYGSGNRVNINTADKTLLFGLISRLIKSKNETETQQIVDWIDENRNFKNQSEFLKGLQTLFGYESGDLDPLILSSLVYQSSVFSIVATGTVGTGDDVITTTIRAVIAQPTQRPPPDQVVQLIGGMQVLYWRID